MNCLELLRDHYLLQNCNSIEETEKIVQENPHLIDNGYIVKKKFHVPRILGEEDYKGFYYSFTELGNQVKNDGKIKQANNLLEKVLSKTL